MLWGAFNNATQAMMATSHDLGTISQNVANVNTAGYKRKETMFKTLLSEQRATAAPGARSMFTVKAVDRTHISNQGVLTPSGHWSDLAINGQGFFMVAPPTTPTATSRSGVPSQPSTDDPDAVFYTRDGAWSRAYGEDTNPNLARNYFVTGSGQYLLGYMADDTGAIPATGMLQPVYTLGVRPIDNNGTAAVDQTATRTAAQSIMPGRATTEAAIVATLPNSATMTASSVDKTMSVTDPNTGTAHNITLNWTRVNGTTWTVTPSVDAALGTVTSGAMTVTMDALGVVRSVAGGSNITVDWTSGAVNSTHDALGTASPYTDTTNTTIRDPNGVQHTVDMAWTRVAGNIWTVTPTLPPGLGSATVTATTVALDGSGRIISPANGKIDVTIDWDDGTYGATAATSTRQLNLAASKPAISLSGPDIALEKIPVEVFDSNFDGHDVIVGFEKVGVNQWYAHTYAADMDFATTAPTATAVNFLSNGQLDTASVSAIAGSWTWDGGGSATVDIDISNLQQFGSGDLYITDISTDGYGEGEMLRSEFNSVGELVGYFSNGRTRTLFKVPIAQFVSENNLEAISGNLFRRTREAGDVTVSNIEDAVGEPRLVAGSLENSTVDIEDEFTRMIITQKAYSTNATVFRTADEMTTTARDLKA